MRKRNAGHLFVAGPQKVWAGLCALFVLATPSCTGLRYATEERPLFNDYEVVFTEKPESGASILRAELESTIIPEPNNHILWLRPTVAIHNGTKEPKEPNKGIRNWLKYKIGNAATYLDEVPLANIDKAMENRLINRGHFTAHVTHQVEKKRKLAEVTFTVETGPLHRIRRIMYSDSASRADRTDTLAMDLVEAQGTSGIATGDPYDLDALIKERSRVAGILRNKGYYRFRDDDLEFIADTTVGDTQVDLLLRVKLGTTPEEQARYHLGKVYVHGDFDELLVANDTLDLDTVHYVDHLGMYRPSTILRGVFLAEGQMYSERLTDQTRRYLSSYGVFRKTQVKFTPDSLDPTRLHTDVLLSPQKRFSLNTELNAVSKSNNFAGPGAKIGVKDRGLFRGAEVLSMDLNGRFETQISGDGKGTNAYEFGVKAELSIPKLVGLSKLPSARSFTPTTRIEAGYGFYRRISLYGIRTASTGFRYAWRRNNMVWHDFQPVEISFNDLYYTTPEFDDYLDDNPSIKQSLEEQFIVGMGYTYTRATQKGQSDLSWWLLSMGIDESGALLGASLNALRGPSEDGGHTLFGQKFSQYLRLRPEVVWHQRIGAYGSQLVWRLQTSLAAPYGNSTTIPFVKQFYSGGTNSLRGFRARSVGPGTYSPETDPNQDNANDNLQVDQVGDIKFESNIEYRFPIAGAMKGAVFTDVGNVWLWNEDPQRPGGQFQLDRMMQELAVAA
ncbi:MAG: BamA/TamA family outer membrane protein, partial [Flavobacteriales bacterium]|nr:BamA/TamA family outer membrane protein [Flavobacteriales bacterium]